MSVCVVVRLLLLVEFSFNLVCSCVFSFIYFHFEFECSLEFCLKICDIVRLFLFYDFLCSLVCLFVCLFVSIFYIFFLLFVHFILNFRNLVSLYILIINVSTSGICLGLPNLVASVVLAFVKLYIYIMNYISFSYQLASSSTVFVCFVCFCYLTCFSICVSLIRVTWMFFCCIEICVCVCLDFNLLRFNLIWLFKILLYFLLLLFLEDLNVVGMNIVVIIFHRFVVVVFGSGGRICCGQCLMDRSYPSTLVIIMNTIMDVGYFYIFNHIYTFIKN